MDRVILKFLGPVGKTDYVVSRKLLSESSDFFAGLFAVGSDDDTYYIDRDCDAFHYVLKIIIDPTCSARCRYANDLKFYGLECKILHKWIYCDKLYRCIDCGASIPEKECCEWSHRQKCVDRNICKRKYCGKCREHCRCEQFDSRF
jgi:hypothetical protein